ncbi:hypothetical protein B0H34DRAFT_736970 [Crassisporium funariophilum]|nr:hypothetical protein B0H34DRAFT_736970 [Crassisporium funariophilum]
MNTFDTFLRPEIEWRGAPLDQWAAWKWEATKLDLLEVYSDKVVWKPNLDHALLLQHFQVGEAEEKDRSKPLRVFFVTDLNFTRLAIPTDVHHPEETSTAYWMHKRFGVSPRFFQCVTSNGTSWFMVSKFSEIVRGQDREAVSLGTPVLGLHMSETSKTQLGHCVTTLTWVHMSLQAERDVATSLTSVWV